MDNILCVNVRGLNHGDKQKLVKEFIVVHKVGLVALLETRIKTQNMGRMYLNMFSNWCFKTNSSWHHGGRIVIAWNALIFHVNILFCSSQIMHLQVEVINKSLKFNTTFVYGFNKEE